MGFYHGVPIGEYRLDEEGWVEVFWTSGTYLYIDRVPGEIPVIPIVAGVYHSPNLLFLFIIAFLIVRVLDNSDNVLGRPF